ncbi:YcxB family protein [Aquamicrobium sp. LC103]|uniref:YcxB family protein n=1 Tax=Aquamicrobium sp. LC103 TaxID=1120658 RepID=UPI00063EBA92|nr:YcxB family protein [Aquamicrobium sp. LC103]TKT80019.1 YcxB family protein [Aquamicrobium sp. LC103]
MITATPSTSASFTITAEDYANALRLHMRRYWVTKSGPKLFIAAMFALCLIAMIASGFDPTPTTVAIVVMVGTAIWPLLAYFLLIPWQARKIYREDKTLQHPIEASWTRDAYFASTATVTNTIPWSDYFGWSADEKMVLLMQSPVLFQMLPRHALSGEQAEDLIGHLEKSGLRRI